MNTAPATTVLLEQEKARCDSRAHKRNKDLRKQLLGSSKYERKEHSNLAGQYKNQQSTSILITWSLKPQI